MILNERAHDLRHQPLETGVEPLFLGVNKGVLFNQPTGIARHKIFQYHVVHSAKRYPKYLPINPKSASSAAYQGGHNGH